MLTDENMQVCAFNTYFSQKWLDQALSVAKSHEETNNMLASQWKTVSGYRNVLLCPACDIKMWVCIVCVLQGCLRREIQMRCFTQVIVAAPATPASTARSQVWEPPFIFWFLTHSWHIQTSWFSVSLYACMRVLYRFKLFVLSVLIKALWVYL